MPERTRPQPGPGFTRRQILGAAGALAAGTTLHGGLSGDPMDPAPEAPLPLRRESFLNWSGELRVPGAWTASPRTPQDLADLADWALDHGWRLRPRGMGHGWSPLLAAGGRPLPPVLLADLTADMDGVRVGGGRTVTAQAGASLERLWAAAGGAGLAAATTPAPGNLTLGGALAIGAHGTVLPGGAVPGWTWGSLGNAVLALEAVVWDPAAGRHRVRAFSRRDPEMGALLVHAGRGLITEATLQLGTDVNLRCRSFTDIPAEELYASPALAGPRSFQALAEAGRVESTWFPFTASPWLRVWSEAPEPPPGARILEGPYPYTFANVVSREASGALAGWLRERPARTPGFLGLEWALASAGLDLTGTRDVWGPSRFSTLHVLPSTVRYHVSGHAILCRRADLQRVVSAFHGAVTELLEANRARGCFPVNGPVDLRASGLDHPEEAAGPGAREALLSPLRPRPDRPWDCALWVEVLTLPGTPGAARFYAELEAWMLAHFSGGDAAVRVEWSKGWAYGPDGAWTAPEVLDGHIPRSFTEGFAAHAGWASAVAGLERLDPHGVFSSPLLDRLFRKGR